MRYRYAIVRPPGKSYLNALSSTGQSKNVDLEKALFQHQKYCQILKKIGLTIIKLPVDERYPDGCFVEDPFVIFGNNALMTILGVPSRRGEGEAIYQVLKNFKKIKKMKFSATMDGGDVLITPKKIFIGLSKRTNLLGIKQFKELLKDENLPEIVSVSVKKCLHLKTGVTYIGKNSLLISELIDRNYFERFSKISVPEEEAYGANCLGIGNFVLAPKGYPFIAREIKKLDFELIELEISEFKKADGGITCLSLLF